MENEVICCLRRALGYSCVGDIKSVDDVGGIITNGGTGSNTTALLMACNRFICINNIKGALDESFKVIVPQGIGHYSIRCSLAWIHCASVIEAPTKGYRYDLDALSHILEKQKGKVVAVVCYAGDSRTMTIEHLDKVIKLVKMHDSNIWCHVDACHGFSLAFSKRLRYKLNGIDESDSISCDPHKVFALPYCCSALLVKDPKSFEFIKTESDLITNDPLSYGKITPFIGSKSWISLKLWFFLKCMGMDRIGDMVERRAELAEYFSNKISNSNCFSVINKIDYNSVVFSVDTSKYAGAKEDSIIEDNIINKMIYFKMLEDGEYYLHSFPIVNQSDKLENGQIYECLRYMSGNDNLTRHEIDEMVIYLENSFLSFYKKAYE